MARTHATDQGNIPATPEFETARDAEEAAAAVEQARPKEPTDAEKLEALLEGGAAVTAIKARIAAARQR